MIETKGNMEKSEEYLKRYAAVVNYIDENKEKRVYRGRKQNLEKYTRMVIYFMRNQDRVNANRNNLNFLYKTLDILTPETDESIKLKSVLLRILNINRPFDNSLNELEKFRIEFLNRHWKDGIY